MFMLHIFALSNPKTLLLLYLEFLVTPRSHIIRDSQKYNLPTYVMPTLPEGTPKSRGFTQLIDDEKMSEV